MSAPPTRLHELSPTRVRLVAAAVFIGMFALLMGTLDMGFSRDESFYFSYGEGYQDWFVEAEKATTPEETERVFGRDNVIKTWIGNFEHPPLMKALFGFSWRLFARKDRRIVNLVARGPGLELDVQTTPATGFDQGSQVTLLAPQGQGMSPTDPARELAVGMVIERTSDRTHVRIEADPKTAEALRDRCSAPLVQSPPSAIPITACQVRENRALAIMQESTAFRLPGALSGALAVMLTFLLGYELFGWLVGLFGGFLFVFVPEHFYHAHVTCFDMPITAATLFVFYAFWRARSSHAWALVTAVAWGLALLTKLNGFFLPVTLVFWWLWTGRDHFHVTRDRWHVSVRLPPLPRALLVMPVVALCMLFAFWPKLWFDPMRAIRDYFGFHLGHEHYMQYWLGEPLQVPPFPFGYAFGKSFFTYTEVFIILLFVGALFLAPPRGWWTWARGIFGRGPRGRGVSETEKVGIFVFVAGMVPILIITVPGTPIFGGIKHWMPGAPFLALIAGYGLFRLLAFVRVPNHLAAVVALLLLAHPAKASIEDAWVGSSHYNSLFAGGLQGAADKRLMRAFWGHSTQEALAWLNANAPYGARVFWQDTTWGAVDAYQKDGHLRHDIKNAPGEYGADIALIDGNQAFWELDVSTRKAMGVAGPDWIVTGEGVPYLSVYVRPGLLTR